MPTQHSDRSRNLVCEWCGVDFIRPGTRGPRPRFCSMKCRGRWAYSQPHIKAYQKAYSQRPDRRAAAAARSRKRYATEEYRTWARNRWRQAEFFGIEIPAPYTGHRWLEMARQAVGAEHLDSSTPWADDYHDEMGEAVLALLEGRDMDEAVKDYRRREYIPRNRTLHLDDWGDDPEEQARWFEKVMPTVESAEDEVVAGEAITYELKARINWSKNKKAGLKAGSRKGSRGPNRSHRRFRRHDEGYRSREEYAA
jgi:hypothetical protein